MADTRAVWKTELPLTADEIVVDLPAGAQPVHVDRAPSGAPAVWWRVDPARPKTPLRLQVCGTGDRFDARAVVLGSYVDGSFVWHVIEHSDPRPATRPGR